MFLKEAIEKIYNDPKTSRKENSELKKACENALEQLNVDIEKRKEQSSSGTGVLPNRNNFILADPYFFLFELASKSQSVEIVIKSLDSIGKLINYDHLLGDSVDAADPNQKLIDRVVQTICKTFHGYNTHKRIELIIIQTILSLVLKNKIHGQSLLSGVQCCFNIYLSTRDSVNKSTARGILTQVINEVFKRLEASESDKNAAFLNDDVVIKSTIDMLIDQVVSNESAEANLDGSRSHNSSCSNLSASNPFSNNNTSGSTVNDAQSEQGEYTNAGLEIKSLEEMDAFLIFRALCRLSERNVDVFEMDSPEFHSILLSLDMILLIVQNFNTQLPDKHSFIHVIRMFLCKALTKNSASRVREVFEKTLAIFVLLTNKFKIYLRAHIEVFFKEIIFPILESVSSSFDYKWITINTIYKICDDSQNIVDFYFNYDCHPTSSNIFEKLIGYLAKISSDNTAETTPNATQLVKEQEKRMREIALDCLVKILTSLLVSYEELYTGRTSDTASNRGDVAENDESKMAGNSSSSNLDLINQFVQIKQQKSIIEYGIDLFEKKPKHGVKFLQEKGLLGTTAADIAMFLYKEERLDKTAIGDYIGEGDDFNKSVMYAYIDIFDFSDMNIVQALRRLLDGFRLPGEAQKIDRLVEKFASRYLQCNSGSNIFRSADVVYILSYSMIMLATDLHSAHIRKKMTKEDYIKMNRGINDDKDLPDELLLEIYDDIAACELKTKPGSSKRPKIDFINANYRQRKLFQTLELESIAQTAHALHVIPMFSLVWSPCLASFSIGLQTSDDDYIWKKCLAGFRYGIRVACLFQQNTERDAYIKALTQFTLLNTTAKYSLHNMQPKNIESIKLLITLGNEDGNYLDNWWYVLLKVISQLELAQHINANRKDSQTEFKNVLNIDEKSLTTLQTCLSDASSQSLAVAVDRIFTNSSKLTGEAIVHFVRALCTVSHEELAIPGSPQMLMLRKIVEVSAYNMDRIRIEWSMIWNVLGEHFNIAGCSFNEEISSFALDSLRQLSTKFLEKGELPNFRLQSEFLRPFETIMNRNKSIACRDMIIDCLINMIRSHANRIRSGWTNIFSVFAIAASEQREKTVQTVYDTTKVVLEQVYKERFVEVLDSFQEVIKCLSELACNGSFSQVSSNAFQLIKKAASLVSENTDLINSHNIDDELSQHSYEQKIWIKAWFPIIFELSCVINRGKLDERTMSLNTMFTIIKTYGKEFRVDWWNDLFKIVFRIFDFSKLNELGNEKNEWMLNTCNLALCSIVDVFTYYYDELAPLFLSNVYQQFYLCVQHGNEELAKVAVECFENLVISNGSKFEKHMWEETITLIIDIFESATPDFKTTDPEIWNSVHSTIVNSNPDSIMLNGIHPTKHQSEDESPLEQNGILPSNMTQKSGPYQDFSVQSSSLTRCIVQLELVDKVSCILFGRNAFKVEGPAKRPTSNNHFAQQNDSISQSPAANEDVPMYSPMYDFIPTELLLRIVSEMIKVHKIACEFSTNRELRTVLMKSSLKKQFKTSDLQKQETHSIHCALNLLFRLYFKSKPGTEQMDKFKNELISVTNSALNYYLAIQSNQHRASWVSVLQLLFNRLSDLPNEHFEALGVEFRRSLAGIVKSEEQPIVRDAVHRFIIRSII